MADLQRISGVERSQFQYQTLSVEQVQRRISLFTGDHMEQARKIEVRQGEVIALPAFDPAERQEVISIFRDATPDQRIRLAEAGNQMFQGLVATSEALRAGGAPTVSPTFRNTVQYAAEQYMAVRGEADANRATSAVLEMAVTSSESDLYGFAHELQDNLAAKKTLREEIADFRSQVTDADWTKANGKGELPFDVPDGKGGYKTELMTKDGTQSHLDTLQGKLDTMGDMTQTAQMRLQDAMNKQSQAIQTLSAIMKNLHDTIKGVLNNLR